MTRVVPDLAWLAARHTWQPRDNDSVSVEASPGHPLRIQVRESNTGATIRLELGDVEYGQPAARTRPRVADAFVEDSALVVPHTLATALGLQLTVSLSIDGPFVNAEFRMTTVEPVEQVTARFEAGLQDEVVLRAFDNLPAMPVPADGEVVLRPANPHGVVVAERQSQIHWIILADLGATGWCQLPAGETPAVADYRLFGLALEKGVILINRVGLLAWPTTEDLSRLPEVYAAWLKRTSYL